MNLNSGAESTIFGLLTVEALDANPDVAAIARASASVQFRDGPQTIEAEAASLTGPAEVVPANPVNTGESQWSGGAYVELATGSTLSWTIPADDQPRLVQAIVNRVPGPAAVSDFASGTENLGAAQYGGGGAQGVCPHRMRCSRSPWQESCPKRDPADRQHAGRPGNSTRFCSPR